MYLNKPMQKTREKVFRVLLKHSMVSMYDIMREADISSSSLVKFHVDKLIEMGKIERIERCKYKILSAENPPMEPCHF